eukprot:UN16529
MTFLIFSSKAFYSNIIERGIDMLPKRSTPVDQNSGYESIHSQLFVAARNPLAARKSLILKSDQNGRTQKH